MSDSRHPHEGGPPHAGDDDDRHDETALPLERNLAKLLRGAYRPPRPDPAFQARLLQRMRARQRLGLGAGRQWRSAVLVAAAAVIGISLFFVVPRFLSPEVGSARELYVANETVTRWQRVEDAPAMSPGDCLALVSGDSVIQRISEATQIRLEPNTILKTTSARHDRDVLLRGAANVSVGRDDNYVLATPILEILARGAEFEVVVTQQPPLSPLTEEYLEMNKAKIITGSALAVGAVVLVSILVNQQDDSGGVTVRRGNESTRLETGVAANFDSSVSGPAGPPSNGPSGTPPNSAAATTSAETAPLPVVSSDGEARTLVAGVVVDRTGAPLAGAVAVLRSSAASPDPLSAPSTTDEHGAFSLSVPAHAPGEVFVSLDRYESAAVPWQPVQTEATVADPEGTSAAAPDESGARAAFTGDDAPKEEANAGTLLVTLDHETAFAGRVSQSASGEPVDSFLLGYQRYEDGWQWFDPVVKAQSAADGSFYAGGIDPGRYRVWVYREGYSRSEPVLLKLDRNEFVEGLEITLTPGVSLVVRAFAERTGAPITGALVYSHLDHIPGTVDYVNRTDVDGRLKNAGTTDAAGSCNLMDLRAGAHYVRVLHPDYAPREVEITLADDEHREIEVTLAEGSSIFGSVIDANGEPMTEAMVLAVTMTMRQDLAQISRGLVDADGTYRVRNLGPGPYVVVRIDPAAEESSKVQMSFVNAGKDTQVDFIEVATLATLRGRILDDRERPLPKMSVSAGYLDPVTGFDFQSAVTDEEGRFEIRNLKPQKYSISVAENFSYSSAVVGEIEIERPIDYDADYTVYDLTVEGRVTDAEATTPLADVEMILLRMKGGVPSEFAGRGVSNAEGRYVIQHVQPGEYQLLASGNQLAPSMTQTFELEPTHSRKSVHDFRLSAGAGVRVRVVDSRETPLSGANVIVRDASGEFVNQGLPPRTDGDGTYAYTRLLAGPHGLEISLEGYEPTSVSFEAEIGKVKEVRVVLAPGP